MNKTTKMTSSIDPRIFQILTGKANISRSSEIVAMALQVPELSPRELATRFTDSRNHPSIGCSRRTI
jgi:hypothetical protein